MKIDIHVHTKKIKQGDADTRNIEAKKFAEIMSATEVKIAAITNHNAFDLSQFEAIVKEVNNDMQIWPGIELDIDDNGRRSHLIVIVSPTKSREFSNRVESITKNNSPDIFSISIEDVLIKFESLNPLYVAHYQQKKPDLSIESIDIIIEKTAYKSRVLKEVTNSISAGIYISHGHCSIYGSDIQNWDKYEELSNDLPDLRLPVESFEHFCLLLEKDVATINTILDKKTPEKLILQPFEDKKKFELKIYNDINVLFGSKGTGKTKILQAIAKHYQSIGITASVFESKTEKLEALYDMKGKGFSINLNDYGINYCTTEIDTIKKATEVDITNPSRYIQCFTTELKNKNAKRILIKDFAIEDNSKTDRKFKSIDTSQNKISEFIKFLSDDEAIKTYVRAENVIKLQDILATVIGEMQNERDNSFTELKKIQLFNGLITVFKKEISRKTSTPEKPSETGFQKYAMNRINLENIINTIKFSINTAIPHSQELVGCLGKKGDLYCKTEINIQNGSIVDGRLNSVSAVTKNPQREFAKKISEINSSIYTPCLFEKVSELNGIETIDSILSIYELVLFKRYFVVNDKPYTPSNGEVSMLLLQNELEENKDVYILDEPEKSLGNEYINDVIVPLIKEKARVGKKIFISTHDANIAVRTLPYNSIYREHRSDGYETYIGNPFSNNLISLLDENRILDWKMTSMKTLEGGKEAFGERGRIYGNV